MSQVYFRNNLLAWTLKNSKDHPWKGEKDPYKVWLSEIILQQTRVAQGTSYYLNFIEKFPTVFALAKADGDTVMKLWEGLGYYSRARNLHHAAKYIAKDLNGVFPKKYDDIIKLKGVGSYTAAAISSFAYDQPYAVVDGNVIRVLSRYFTIHTPFDTTLGKKEFQRIAQQCLHKKKAALYNQAIMDFGANVCKPKNPLCDICPMQSKCKAFKQKTITRHPYKSKKINIKNRYFLFLIIEKDDKIFIKKREGSDIWKGLFQFPLIETNEKSFKLKEITDRAITNFLQSDKTLKIKKTSKVFIQLLSHQKIHAKFIIIESSFVSFKDYIPIGKEKFSNFAFPKVINLFLQNK